LRSVALEAGGKRLRIGFGHVRGSLRAAGRPAGFSLRTPDGREVVRVYKTTLEGDSVLLHLTDDPLPSETQIWYGYGLNPYCNITDAEDAAVPGFGPISLPTE
jgi:sialate O-acetylesterase